MVFRFENYWLEHEDFMAVMLQGWSSISQQQDCAKNLSAKFKNLRRVFKAWKAHLPNLAAVIKNTKEVIQWLDIIEETRDLTLEE
jgi:hypothetical protein